MSLYFALVLVVVAACVGASGAQPDETAAAPAVRRLRSAPEGCGRAPHPYAPSWLVSGSSVSAAAATVFKSAPLPPLPPPGGAAHPTHRPAFPAATIKNVNTATTRDAETVGPRGGAVRQFCARAEVRAAATGGFPGGLIKAKIVAAPAATFVTYLARAMGGGGTHAAEGLLVLLFVLLYLARQNKGRGARTAGAGRGGRSTVQWWRRGTRRARVQAGDLWYVVTFNYVWGCTLASCRRSLGGAHFFVPRLGQPLV